MSEFDDMSMELFKVAEVDIPDTNDWTDFTETDDVRIDTAEFLDATNTSDLSLDLGPSENDIQSEAEKAADYARSYGFNKAGDYIERH